MKTVQQLKNYKCQALDGRDITRLAVFLPEEDLATLGVQLLDEYKGKHIMTPLTRDNVLQQLERDVAFGFEKALAQRGISAGLMYEVVKMWLWVLEEGLEDFNKYAFYGLPLFKAVALKYGFNNPIGDDRGDEPKYESN